MGPAYAPIVPILPVLNIPAILAGVLKAATI
jgi:hypothetical protein